MNRQIKGIFTKFTIPFSGIFPYPGISFWLLILSLLVLTFCKKMDLAEQSKEAVPAATPTLVQDGENVPAEAGKSAALKKAKAMSKDTESDAGYFAAPGDLKMPLADKRLLEHRADLSLEVKNIFSTRLKLYHLAAQYGFIQKAGGRINEESTSLHFTFQVPAEKLYPFLGEISALGLVESENLEVTDHTPEYHRQTLKQKRMQKRLARREKNLAAGTAKTADFLAQQKALEDTENADDETKFARWQIRDKVKWSVVNLNIYESGHRTPDIQIPNFTAAFFGLADLLLDILYALIYLIPLAAIGYGIYRLARKLWPFLKAKRE